MVLVTNHSKSLSPAALVSSLCVFILLLPTQVGQNMSIWLIRTVFY